MQGNPLPQSSLLSSTIFAGLVLPIGSVAMVFDVANQPLPLLHRTFPEYAYRAIVIGRIGYWKSHSSVSTASV
jgi:hypothetical protein